MVPLEWIGEIGGLGVRVTILNVAVRLFHTSVCAGMLSLLYSYVELLWLREPLRVVVHGVLIRIVSVGFATALLEENAHGVENDDGTLGNECAAIGKVLSAHVGGTQPEGVVDTFNFLCCMSDIDAP